VILDIPKVAVSEMVLGTFSGVQFVAIYQIPLPGLELQVALPAARAEGRSEKEASETAATRRVSSKGFIVMVRSNHAGFDFSGLIKVVLFFTPFYENWPAKFELFQNIRAGSGAKI
jgi:hypothetical protein